MQKSEIIAFIRSNPLFFLATCEGDQARVRGIMLHRIDEDGNILFTVGKNKAVCQQLRSNPNIECCFYANETQIRLCGELTESEDQNLKQEIIEARPFMKPWIEAAGFEVMVVFILTKCRATWWNADNPLARKRFVNLFDE